MNTIIDKEKCVGCGTCVALAPDTFILEGDKAVALDKPADEKETIQMAVDSCPTQAIVVE